MFGIDDAITAVTTLADTTEAIAPVVGYEGLYEVSSDGVVYSSRFGIKKAMKGCTDAQGYILYTMRKNGIRRRELGHRVVAMAFIDKAYGKYQVNHKNGIKSDNRVSNLEWCTQSENNTHSYMELGRKSSLIIKKGRQHPASKKVIGCNVGNGVFKEYDFVDQVRIDGFSPDSVRLCAKGKQEVYKNHVWFWG